MDDKKPRIQWHGIFEQTHADPGEAVPVVITRDVGTAICCAQGLVQRPDGLGEWAIFRVTRSGRIIGEKPVLTWRDIPLGKAA